MLGRRVLLTDQNPEAVRVMKERFQGRDAVWFCDAEQTGEAMRSLGNESPISGGHIY